MLPALPGQADGYAVLLDSRPMHLPGGGVLRVRPAKLAAAIAAEWQQAGGGKGGEMSFADTPLTRLAGTALQRIAPDPAQSSMPSPRYGESDLLCYRADAPEALVQRQTQAWQPWLDWAALTYDAPLRVTTGVGHVQPASRQHPRAAQRGGGAGRGCAGRPGHRRAGAGQPGAGAGAGGGRDWMPPRRINLAAWTSCSRRS